METLVLVFDNIIFYNIVFINTYYRRAPTSRFDATNHQVHPMSSPQPVIFGETLFDCFPDGAEVLGGAPFNVAWHLQAFGLKPQLITRVGADERGQRIIGTLTEWGMATDAIQIDPDRSTGTVSVTMVDGEPHFHISPDQAYGAIEATPLHLSGPNALLYHGSLALWHKSAQDALKKVKHHCSCPLFMDVNLRSPWWQRNTVLALLEAARWVKMNLDELQLLYPHHHHAEERIKELFSTCDLELLILTKGAQGASCHHRNGETYQVRPSNKVPVVDTVGAGDALSSVCILGLMQGWPLETMLARGQQFASLIVGRQGATINHRQPYTDLLHHWSRDDG